MIPAHALVDPPPPSPRDAPAQQVAFPAALAHRLSVSTNADLADDVRIDRATDGTGRARGFYIAPKLIIATVLPGLNVPDWQLFDSFYRANRMQPFTIPWGPCGAEVALPVLFADPPKRRFHGGGLSTVTFNLVEFP